ncbi:type II membrane protein [Russula earlei]|uniref:Type II membrane protein n=1 Tax=Russula earlei TaxID=71964 RepID=A0ACC0U2I2_9AGAM|nr:type II membrane protein [Russula earlei]
MIIRQRGTLLPWLLLLLISAARSQSDTECHKSINDATYDFTALSGDQTVSRTRLSPPTNMTDTLRFNVCNALSLLEDVSSDDQCPNGTWACLSTTNIKQGVSDRVVAVIPIAHEPELQAEYTMLSSPRGVKITLHGLSYPSPTTSEPTPQAFVLNLLCATEQSQPQFSSYDGTQATVEWSAPSGCNFRSPTEGDSETPKEAVGSGIGWFFLLLFIAFAGYFSLGAYYNYTTYGATGVDLIPHRDFWREVPYMLRDVVSHLCSSFQSRPSASRGGYISV